jgi:hypothetical protein
MREPATCKTCPWCYELADDQVGDGECRKSPPSPVPEQGHWFGVWPIVYQDDWCGEHPDRKRVTEGGTKTEEEP